MPFNRVNLSDTQQFQRIDAEFYKTEYQEAFQRVLSCQGERLAQLARITDGIHASPDVSENGIRYISAKCVKDNEFVTDDCLSISISQHERSPRTQLHTGDVIITTVGTIGNVAVVDEDITPCNSDRHVGIIRVSNSETLSPYYLATFLNSKYGRFQSTREAAGNVQLNLYIRNIGHIIVPRLGGSEIEIADLTKRAYSQRKASKELYIQAQQLLEDPGEDLAREDPSHLVERRHAVLRVQAPVEDLGEGVGGQACERV